MGSQAGLTTYLDYNSGAPLSLGARASIQQTLSLLETGAGNPSSVHRAGRLAKRIVADARDSLAIALGGVDPEQLVITGSGTESNQTVVRSVLGRALKNSTRPLWVLSPVEHDSVLQLKDWFTSQGGECRDLPVLHTGEVDLREETLGQVIEDRTALVSLIWVGNETGILHDPKLLTSHIQKRKLSCKICIDGAQALGKTPLDIEKIGADYITFSGHKIGGPAGVGVLYVRRGAPLDALMPGKQEKGRRGGTENLLGIAGLGGAARDMSRADLPSDELRDRFERAVLGQIPGSRIHGQRASRVWNTSNLGFEGIEGESLVLALDLEGFCVSAGSACSSGALEPSHVLMAMGYSHQQAMAALRVSFGRETRWEELEALVQSLETVVDRVRKAQG